MTGSLLEVATYYPNGARETLRANDEVEDFALEPLGFTGKEDDSEVGLVYFGMRYLMPHLGRWASPDPLHIHAGGGGEFGNSYHYVSGNLLQARDPLGLDVEHRVNEDGVRQSRGVVRGADRQVYRSDWFTSGPAAVAAIDAWARNLGGVHGASEAILGPAQAALESSWGGIAGQFHGPNILVDAVTGAVADGARMLEDALSPDTVQARYDEARLQAALACGAALGVAARARLGSGRSGPPRRSYANEGGEFVDDHAPESTTAAPPPSPPPAAPAWSPSRPLAANAVLTRRDRTRTGARLTRTVRTGHAGRVESSSATVGPQHVGAPGQPSGTATNGTSRKFARYMGRVGDVAGHVISRVLGGTGGYASGNIVPLSPTANRALIQFEKGAAARVRAGQSIRYEVEVRYDSATSTRPSEIRATQFDARSGVVIGSTDWIANN